MNRWIEDTQVPKSVDLSRYRILAIFNTLIAHDTALEDLRFFDVDLAHEIPWIGFKFVDSSALEYPKMEKGDNTQLPILMEAQSTNQILFKNQQPLQLTHIPYL